MKFKHLLIDLADKYFPVLSINCPEVSNAFDEHVIDELRQALVYIKGLSNTRALFLTGAGKHFSAGANLIWMQKMVHYDFARNLQDAKTLAMLIKELNSFPLPTVAIVNGATFGGGVGLVAACDIAVAHKDAVFCLSEVKLGLIPSVISPYVISCIGEKAARRYFLTAEKFTAEQAKSLGLINEIYDSNNRQDLFHQLKQNLRQNSPDAMMAAKALINFTGNRPIDNEMIEETVERIANIRISDDGQEGLNAFLEKRKAKWVI